MRLTNSNYNQLAYQTFVIGALGAFIVGSTRYVGNEYDSLLIQKIGLGVAILAMSVIAIYKVVQFAKTNKITYGEIARDVYAKAFRPVKFKKVHLVAITIGAISGAVFGGVFYVGDSQGYLHLGSLVGIIIFTPLTLLLVGVDKPEEETAAKQKRSSDL